MFNAGDHDLTETVVIPFNTFTSDDPSASATVTDFAAGDVYVYQDGVIGTPTGITVSINVVATGNHLIFLDLTDTNDVDFYAAGSRYQVRIEGVTVDGATVNAWVGGFSIGCQLTRAQLANLATVCGAAPGAANGFFIAGTNAATTITSAAGNALTLSSTGTNGHGLSSSGNGTGNGMYLKGGATSGDGLHAAGGTSGGEGIHAMAVGGNAHGAYFVGQGSGEGLHVTGGAGNTGNGAIFEAGSSATNGVGMYCLGVGGGASHGIHAKGGTTGAGMYLERGGASAKDLTLATPSISNLGAVAMTTLTTSGATTLNSLVVSTTTTLTGAVSLGSTLGITGAVTLASTLGVGAVTYAGLAITNALSVGTTTTLAGAVSMPAGLTVDITGNLSGSVGSVTTKTGYALSATGADLILKSSTFALAMADAACDELLAGHTTADTVGLVLNELQDGGRLDLILDAILSMLDDARAEPGQGAPAVNPDAMTKLDYLYKAWRNKSTQTATEYSLYADNTTTKDQAATVADDGTTATKGEVGTGA